VRRTPVMLMAALALVPVTIWTMSGSASAASGSLTVTTYSRTGAKVKTGLTLVNLASNRSYSATSGKAKSLPKGTYAVMASIWTAQGSSNTLGARVLKVSGKARTTIDARSGKALKVSLDKSPGTGWDQQLSARICAGALYSVEAYNGPGHVYVIPNKSKNLAYGYAADWHGVQPGSAYIVSGGASTTVPGTQSHTFKKSALAPVTVSVRRGPGLSTDVQARLQSAAGNDCQGSLGGSIFSGAPPYNAKVYASAGNWLLRAEGWAVEKDQYAGVAGFFKTVKLSAGKTVTQVLFRSAWGPADNLPYVSDKRVYFDTSAMFTDPGFGWSGADGFEASEKSAVTLSLGGKVLKKKSRTDWGGEDAVFGYKLPRKGWYTLNVYGSRYRPGVKFPADLMSHKVNLRMNFYANPRSDKQAPLILPRLAPLGLDLNNTAKKNSTTDVNIMLEQQRQSPDVKYTKATAKKVTAQVSFDFGKTWKSVTVKKTGSTYKASVKNSKSGLVALRSTVVTTGGYTTEVTIYRAYRAG
jgi:hypothetical protein